jgi:hypothetical protein
MADLIFFNNNQYVCAFLDHPQYKLYQRKACKVLVDVGYGPTINWFWPFFNFSADVRTRGKFDISVSGFWVIYTTTGFESRAIQFEALALPLTNTRLPQYLGAAEPGYANKTVMSYSQLVTQIKNIFDPTRLYAGAVPGCLGGMGVTVVSVRVGGGGPCFRGFCTNVGARIVAPSVPLLSVSLRLEIPHVF